MPLVAEPSAVFAFEFSESKAGVAKILESQLSDDHNIVPFAQLQKEDGKLVDTLSGAPGRVLSITRADGKSDRRRFHIQCSSGTNATTFEVILNASDAIPRGADGSGWVVGAPKEL